jgi:hypothetical protein
MASRARGRGGSSEIQLGSLTRRLPINVHIERDADADAARQERADVTLVVRVTVWRSDKQRARSGNLPSGPF